MNIQKFTKRSIEAIEGCQKLAINNGNQEIKPIHMLKALLSVDESLIKTLISKMNIDTKEFENTINNEIQKLPKVGGDVQQYFSNDLNKVLINVEDIAKGMKDEYVSVEHIFLGLIKYQDSTLKNIFNQYNINNQSFLNVLSEVRGNVQVTSDEPEETYDSLNKYGYDLVERAKQRELDPVIGRDQEIRNAIRILSRKTKNNPCLIGEPGVGKTAVIEGRIKKYLHLIWVVL